MSYGKVICSKCGLTLYQRDGTFRWTFRWRHQHDDSPICDNAQAIYPAVTSQDEATKTGLIHLTRYGKV